MKTKMIKVSDNFWNIRGSFKIKGLINVGTHCSLVKKEDGKFILLDSLTPDNQTLKEINKLTGNGTNIEAVINLHPFHTVHVERLHELFPKAKHYGTQRHLDKFPDLKWEKIKSEDKELHEIYSNDLDFFIPKGVDFIPEDENLHFSSVIVYHRDSKTIHVDDTLMYIKLPKLLGFFGISNPISFHPTLAKVLENEIDATDRFESWFKKFIETCSDVENLCTAHTASLISDNKKEISIKERIEKAFKAVSSTLKAHKEKFKTD